MKKRAPIAPTETVESLVRTIRGQKVILDSDLAALYGVTTKRFNEQVRRNSRRFPSDFLFRLTAGEAKVLRSQNATLKTGSGRHRKYAPLAFTESGAVMAANVLNSSQAVRMSLFVVRAFIQMRELLSSSQSLASKLKELETKLTSRLDLHESAIVDVLRRLTDLLDPPAPPDVPEKSMGFHTLLKPSGPL